MQLTAVVDKIRSSQNSVGIKLDGLWVIFLLEGLVAFGTLLTSDFSRFTFEVRLGHLVRHLCVHIMNVRQSVHVL